MTFSLIVIFLLPPLPPPTPSFFSLQIKYIETSTKERMNIKEVFFELVRLIRNERMKESNVNIFVCCVANALVTCVDELLHTLAQHKNLHCIRSHTTKVYLSSPKPSKTVVSLHPIIVTCVDGSKELPVL